VVATTARAETRATAAAEPIALRFDATAGCSTEAAFFDEMSARTSHVRRARPGEAARVLRVSIGRDGARVVGRLVIEDDGTESEPRVVAAPSCAGVVRALAIVAALSIDPAATGATDGTEGPAPTDAPPSASDPSAAIPPDVRPPAQGLSADPPLVGSTAPTHFANAEMLARPASGGAGRPLRFGGGLALDAAGVGVAGTRIGPRAFVELLVGRASPGSFVAFAPSVRASIVRLSSAELSLPSASAKFTWTTARFDGCPIDARLGASLALRPCAGIEAGSLGAEGVGGARDASRTLPWVAAGAFMRAEWTIATALVLTAEAGAFAALRHEDFVFSAQAQPSGSLYSSTEAPRSTYPPIASHTSVGLAVRLP